jgi:hypothetical protein
MVAFARFPCNDGTSSTSDSLYALLLLLLLVLLLLLLPRSLPGWFRLVQHNSARPDPHLRMSCVRYWFLGARRAGRQHHINNMSSVPSRLHNTWWYRLFTGCLPREKYVRPLQAV